MQPTDTSTDFIHFVYGTEGASPLLYLHLNFMQINPSSATHPDYETEDRVKLTNINPDSVAV